MDVRCPSCGATFTISKDYLAQAITKAEKKKHKYHAIDCIRCRKQVKLSINDMRRYAAPPEDEVEAETEVKVEE